MKISMRSHQGQAPIPISKPVTLPPKRLYKSRNETQSPVSFLIVNISFPLSLPPSLPPPFPMPHPSSSLLPLATRRRRRRRCRGDAQDKINNDGGQQGEGEDAGAVAIVEAALAALADALGAPVEGDEGVDHGAHGDGGEEGGRDAADGVAEVEQADRQAAQDDGEVEPRQEGALVGEEDLWLDPRRQGDAFSCIGEGCQLDEMEMSGWREERIESICIGLAGEWSEVCWRYIWEGRKGAVGPLVFIYM